MDVKNSKQINTIFLKNDSFDIDYTYKSKSTFNRVQYCDYQVIARHPVCLLNICETHRGKRREQVFFFISSCFVTSLVLVICATATQEILFKFTMT